MPINTASLKTFAPAMRRQLIEAVGRKLDRLLTSTTPDTLTTYATQIAELRQQEQISRQELLERVAYSWFNRLAALRYLDARGWHPFGAKVLMPATDADTQPELLKLMRNGQLPAELQRHSQEARLNQLLDGQIPTATPAPTPRGRCTGSWCWRCAASITSCCQTCSRGSMTPPSCCCPMTCSPMAPSRRASAARSMMPTATTWRYWAGCISSISPRKKKR